MYYYGTSRTSRKTFKYSHWHANHAWRRRGLVLRCISGRVGLRCRVTRLSLSWPGRRRRSLFRFQVQVGTDGTDSRCLPSLTRPIIRWRIGPGMSRKSRSRLARESRSWRAAAGRARLGYQLLGSGLRQPGPGRRTRIAALRLTVTGVTVTAHRGPGAATLSIKREVNTTSRLGFHLRVGSC